jgi:hypothetical protein
MKVSNSINITRIYQDQVKKAKTEKPDGEFSKLMQNSAGKTEGASRSYPAPQWNQPQQPVLSGVL